MEDFVHLADCWLTGEGGIIGKVIIEIFSFNPAVIFNVSIIIIASYLSFVVGIFSDTCGVAMRVFFVLLEQYLLIL